MAYGQSVGSGRTCHLGACQKDLKGIILHSPLMSGAHSFYSCYLCNGKLGIYPNIHTGWRSCTLIPKVSGVLLCCRRSSYLPNKLNLSENNVLCSCQAMTYCEVLFSVGMRCLSPNMNRWPSWADVFPNITLLPKIEAKTLIMHVSSYHPKIMCTCPRAGVHIRSLSLAIMLPGLTVICVRVLPCSASNRTFT